MIRLEGRKIMYGMFSILPIANLFYWVPLADDIR